MKLRIKDHTIRFRLSQSEVSKLAMEGQVYGVTKFPNATLVYGIEQTEENICAGSFDQRQIKLTVSQKVIQEWYESDQVSIDFTLKVHAGSQLEVLIEKDFKCLLDRPGEDESDLFPNPQARDV